MDGYCRLCRPCGRRTNRSRPGRDPGRHGHGRPSWRIKHGHSQERSPHCPQERGTPHVSHGVSHVGASREPHEQLETQGALDDQAPRLGEAHERPPKARGAEVRGEGLVASAYDGEDLLVPHLVIAQGGVSEMKTVPHGRRLVR